MALDLSVGVRAGRAADEKPLFRPYEQQAAKTAAAEREAPLKTALPPPTTMAYCGAYYGAEMAVACGFYPAVQQWIVPPWQAHPYWALGMMAPRRSQRPLCGRYVRSGPGASDHVMAALRRKVVNRQVVKYWMNVLKVRSQPPADQQSSASGSPKFCQSAND